MVKRRAGRPRKRNVDRQPDGRPKQDENTPPTQETLARRADAMAGVIVLHPQTLAAQLARHQDAGWYIGRLHLVGALTRAQRDAADDWRRIARRYEALLLVPRRPVALAMMEPTGRTPTGFETEADEAAFRRTKRAYESRWDAVAAQGINVLRATTAALRDEQKPLDLIRRGLDALVNR